MIRYRLLYCKAGNDARRADIRAVLRNAGLHPTNSRPRRDLDRVYEDGSRYETPITEATLAKVEKQLASA